MALVLNDRDRKVRDQIQRHVNAVEQLLCTITESAKYEHLPIAHIRFSAKAARCSLQWLINDINAAASKHPHGPNP